jgi:hypothetical protein
MLKLDLKRLKTDVQQCDQDRPADWGGRRLTGAMAIVRDNMKEIEALRDAGASWVSIAEGLARQGVTQGDNQPITAKRLTALIASVKRQAARKAEKLALRAQRQDLPPSAPPKRGSPLVKLARELTDPSRQEARGSSPTEEDIRQANFDKHSNLFRKDAKT